MRSPLFTIVERIEPRWHFAASLSSSVLTVTGTNSSDQITLSIVDRRLSVNINGAVERFTLSSVAQLSILGQNGNDTIDFRTISIPAFARGGSGNDLIFAGGGDDRLLGDSGNDQLYGDGGGDQLDGGAGSDLLSGGAGRDSVNYSSRTANLVITIRRGGYDDGERNERDNVRDDIEGISAGSGDDLITGWKESDLISGGDGSDTIKGDDGQDTLNGDDGDDVIEGNGNNDRLSGGDGDDELDAGNGRNLLYGNAGDDFFDTVNDNTDDAIDGGSGHDHADMDGHWNVDDWDADNSRSIEHRDYDWD
jgi:Ca2+-binding RTX toxin-like protein